MLIIIEGIDLVGKTTFIEQLTKKVNKGIIIKSCYLPGNNFNSNNVLIKNQYQKIYNLIKKTGKKQIIYLDRFYPSQMVYSIKRNFESMNDKWYKNFEKKLLKTPHLLILLDEPENVLNKRLKIRGDDYITINDIKTLKERYIKFYNQSILNKIIIKPSNGFENNYEKIKKVVKCLNVKEEKLQKKI